jgi:transposase
VAAGREVPPKQRLTARRVCQLLVAEHGASLAEVTVQRYVARRRAEPGLDKMQVMVRHVLAFEYFGAVSGRVRYDNLKPAVVRVLRGPDWLGSERFIALRSHYGFTELSDL